MDDYKDCVITNNEVWEVNDGILGERINLNFMPTKHEGRCCEKCGFDFVSVPACGDKICPCHTDSDGAGMREEISKILWGNRMLGTGIKEEQIISLFQSHLSRLHSQILEEVEKEKKSEDHVDPQDRWEAFGYNQALRTSKDIINQAFKDL